MAANPKLPAYMQDKAHVWSQLCTHAMNRKDGVAERTAARRCLVRSYLISRAIKWAKSQARKAA